MKLLTIHKSLALFFIFALMSCAVPNLPTNYELNNNKQVGLLVMSVNHNTDTVTLRYKNINTSEKGTVITSTFQDKIDFDNPKGRLIVLELPIGIYDLYQWETILENHHYSSPLFSAPFTIEQGKSIYIGNLNIEAKLIYPFMIFEHEHTISDMFERDATLLKKKYPKLDILKLEKSISKISIGNNLN